MTFAALHKRVTYLFALLGLTALLLGGEVGWFSMALGASGVIASWFAEGPRIHRESWARRLTVLVFGVFGVQVLRGFAGADVLTLGLEFAGLLQLTRLAHRRTATEHLHVIGLAFLHLLAGTLLSTGLDYALVFLAFVVVAPWMLALTHLRAEIERQHADPVQSSREAEVPSARVTRILESRDLASRGLLLASSLLSFPLFAITAAFFLLFPRVGLGMFTFGDGDTMQTSGFGNTVDLGQFGTIRDDPTVVARVFLPAPPRAGTSDASIRLRGTSFDRYDGTVWTRTPSEGRRREGGFGSIRLGSPRIRRGSRSRDIRIVVEPMDEAVVFLPDGALELRIGSRIASGVDIPRAVLIRPGLDVRLAEPQGLALDYVVTSDPRAMRIPEVLDRGARARLLEVPHGLERVSALARSVAGADAKDPVVADRIETMLRSSGRYRYDLTTTDPRGANPLVHFMFRSRAGHCELFATAMAVMLRARGIPARNVTGFRGGRWNPYGRYYALRNGDAHSWVEAYIDDEWRTYDPTPAARDAAGPTESMFTPIAAWFDAIRVRWARDVIGFDMRRQLELAIRLRNAYRELRGTRGARGDRTLVPWDDAHALPSRGFAAPEFLPVFAVLAIGAAVAFVVLRPRRSSAARIEIDRIYGRFDRAMKRRGTPRGATRTPSEQLEMLRATGFPALDAAAAITDAHARARYGDVALDEAELTLLRSHIRTIERVRQSARA